MARSRSSSSSSGPPSSSSSSSNSSESGFPPILGLSCTASVQSGAENNAIQNSMQRVHRSVQSTFRRPDPQRSVDQAFISKIGSSIAKTMPMTNRPMPTISSGPSRPTSAASSPSSSRSWLARPARACLELAARLAAGDQVDRHRRKQPARAPASGRSARPRARAPRPRSTASRIGRLVTTSLAMRSASSTGTALAVRMLSVRVKRAVLKPRTSRPTSGRCSSAR